MCQSPEEYKKFFIKEYTFWRIELHSNQCYLGRCLIILNRHTENLFDITTNEKDELFTIGSILNNALLKGFNPNILNYSSLGNDMRHLHLHIIPRYKNPVTFADTIFTDERWGHNPSPYNKNFEISDEVYNKIIIEICKNLT